MLIVVVMLDAQWGRWEMKWLSEETTAAQRDSESGHSEEGMKSTADEELKEDFFNSILYRKNCLCCALQALPTVHRMRTSQFIHVRSSIDRCEDISCAHLNATKSIKHGEEKNAAMPLNFISQCFYGEWFCIFIEFNIELSTIFTVFYLFIFPLACCW